MWALQLGSVHAEARRCARSAQFQRHLDSEKVWLFARMMRPEFHVRPVYNAATLEHLGGLSRVRFAQIGNVRMETQEPRISVSSVVVEGLDADLCRTAESELRSLLAPFEQVPLDLVGGVALSVLVTDKMEEHVDRIGRSHGSQAAPYQRQREGGVAGGLVLTAPGGPPWVTTIVLHSSLWSHSDGLGIVNRVYMLAFMFAQVLDHGQSRNTEEDQQGDEHRSHAEAAHLAARFFIDAFDAHCTAVDLCRFWLSSADGTPLQLSEMCGASPIASVFELGEKLSVFATIDVQFYRLTAVGLEDLYTRVGPLLGQTMLMLMHALALHAADDRVDLLMETLSQSAALKAYVLPDFDALRAAIRAADEAERVAGMVAVLERILQRLGLRIEDVSEGGVHVHVAEPVLVPITMDTTVQ